MSHQDSQFTVLESAVEALRAENHFIRRQLGRCRALLAAVAVVVLMALPLRGVTAADEEYNTLRGLLSHLRVVGDDIYLERANLHVRSGLGATDAISTNGLGNLIIGYNEPRALPSGMVTTTREDRTGSHNLVIGDGHHYTSYGGLVAGWGNTIAAPYASISGGKSNTVRGIGASIGGGGGRSADGLLNWVAGGLFQPW